MEERKMASHACPRPVFDRAMPLALASYLSRSPLWRRLHGLDPILQCLPSDITTLHSLSAATERLQLSFVRGSLVSSAARLVPGTECSMKAQVRED